MIRGQLKDLLDGGWIERYHLKGQRMLTRQSVSDHSWRMAAILFYLWPKCRAELLWATIFHDVSERVTGDIPSPVKRYAPAVAEAVHAVSETEERRLGIRFGLTAEEQKVLGWMDRFEGAVHCLDELEMGNRKVIGTMMRYVEYSANPAYRLTAGTDVEMRRAELQDELSRAVHALLNREE